MTLTKENSSQGGLARAKALTREQRVAIGKKAISARYGIPPKATHKGNFLVDFGIDVECYVLDDEQKTAVLSQRGMGSILGFKDGSDLMRFLNSEKIAARGDAILRSKLENPLIFQGPGATRFHGYGAADLIDICEVILKADREGKLQKRQKRHALQAQILTEASAKSGITQLVYALADFDATREETISRYKIYVSEVAHKWRNEFPDELYAEWYRLYDLKKPKRSHPWICRNLTVSHIYTPLAKSNGELLDVLRLTRDQAGVRHTKRLYTFLEERFGIKELRHQIGRILGIAQASETREVYEGHIRRIFGNVPSPEEDEG